MKINNPYVEGKLIKRYKRFLADVELVSGEIVTAHTPNTGSMKGCSDPGSKVWLYDTQNPKRKYRYSWDLVADLSGNMVGIHTGKANLLVKEAIELAIITELGGYKTIKTEVNYKSSGCRFDLFLSEHELKPDCFVEVKNVTAIDDNGVAIFPDAVTQRGKKHLETLIDVVHDGMRAIMVFCIQRDDVFAFRAAREIDPAYADMLKLAYNQGVEIVAYKSFLSPTEIKLITPVKIKNL